MKALITGAGGFIGAHLASALINQGIKVRGLFMPGEAGAGALQKQGGEIVYGDLTKPDTLRGITTGIDTVFHLATRTLDWGTRSQFEKVMVQGTKHLLAESKGQITRFIYFSSVAALGLGRDLAGVTEAARPKKCGIPYCDTKIIAEEMVKRFCGQNRIDYTIIRPANVFGPGSVWVREILDAFQRGPFPLVNGGKAPGAFVYIDNLIDGTLIAAQSKTAIGKTYHFRDDYPITWKEYLTTLGQWVGKKPMGNIPFTLAWYLGSFFERTLAPRGIRPPITRLAAGVMGKNLDVDAHRARQELGWQSRISQETAMKKIETWARAHYQIPDTSRKSEFTGKVVYITGGSSGIGLALAIRLARRGARLVLLARNREKLKAARQEIEKIQHDSHQQIHTFSLDVADADDVNQKMEKAMAEAGVPDILINNAGIVDTNYFENISPDSFDKVIKVNLYGVRHMMAALLPAMKQRQKGHIVNMASGAALTGIFGYSSYSASKYAVLGLSEVLRSELKPYHIAMSVVCPPRVITPMDEKEAKIIPPETKAVKQLAGCLTADYVAKVILKGIEKKKFLIIPGHTMKALYHLQRYLGAGIFRGTTDFIIKMAKRRADKK